MTRYYKDSTKDKEFKTQFLKLIDLLQDWGTENKCGVEISSFSYIKSNFFNPSLTGSQSSIYFETIKMNLEKILLALRNKKLDLKVRKKEFTRLCNHFTVCGPGLYTHIEAAQTALCSASSISNWLKNLRTFIIETYCNQFIEKNKVSGGNSIHVINAFSSYALDQHWTSNFTAGQIDDPFTSHVNIDADDLLAFHEYFITEYNPLAIRECIEFNMQDGLFNIIHSYGYKLNVWQAFDNNYLRLVNDLNLFFETLGIEELKADIFLELNEEGTEFRIYLHRIIDKICDPFIQSNLYFLPKEKSYIELIPHHYVSEEAKTCDSVDFTHWESITPNEFFDVFLMYFTRTLAKYKEKLLNQIAFTPLDTALREIDVNIFIELIKKIPEPDTQLELILKKLITTTPIKTLFAADYFISLFTIIDACVPTEKAKEYLKYLAPLDIFFIKGRTLKYPIDQDASLFSAIVTNKDLKQAIFKIYDINQEPTKTLTSEAKIPIEERKIIPVLMQTEESVFLKSIEENFDLNQLLSLSFPMSDKGNTTEEKTSELFSCLIDDFELPELKGEKEKHFLCPSKAKGDQLMLFNGKKWQALLQSNHDFHIQQSDPLYDSCTRHFFKKGRVLYQCQGDGKGSFLVLMRLVTPAQTPFAMIKFFSGKGVNYLL